MDNFNTLPMPEGFGKQVETPQGWRFRHCATFFVGDMCPDCHKQGFINAAASLNEPAAATEVKPEPGTETAPPAPQGTEKFEIKGAVTVTDTPVADLTEKLTGQTAADASQDAPEGTQDAPTGDAPTSAAPAAQEGADAPSDLPGATQEDLLLNQAAAAVTAGDTEAAAQLVTDANAAAKTGGKQTRKAPPKTV